MLKLRFCWLVMLMKLRYASTWWYSCAFTLAFDSSFVAIHYCPTCIKVMYISDCNGVCVQRHFFFKTNDAPEKVRYCTNYIRQSLSVIFLILKDFGKFIIKLCIILLINQLHMAGRLLLIDKFKPGELGSNLYPCQRVLSSLLTATLGLPYFFLQQSRYLTFKF